MPDSPVAPSAPEIHISEAPIDSIDEEAVEQSPSSNIAVSCEVPEDFQAPASPADKTEEAQEELPEDGQLQDEDYLGSLSGTPIPSPPKVVERTESDIEYDTQFTIESPAEVFWRKDQKTREGIRYRTYCKQHGILPSGYYQRHLYDENLNVRYLGLTAAGLEPVLKSLEDNTEVNYIDLSLNDLGGEGISELVRFLADNNMIYGIVLQNNGMTIASLVDVCQLLRENAYLSDVDISDNHLGDTGGLVIADALPTFETLTTLHLRNIGLGESCSKALGKGISKNVILKHLDLSWNKFRGREAKEFLALLAKNSTITHLNLAYNGFADRCAESLSVCMRKMSLKHFDIRNNRLTHEGAVAIAKGLKATTTIQFFDISLNPLRHEGAMLMVDALDTDESPVKTLMMKSVVVHKPFIRYLRNVLSRRDKVIIYGDAYGDYTLKHAKPVRPEPVEKPKAAAEPAPDDKKKKKKKKKKKVVEKDPFVHFLEDANKRGVDIEDALSHYDMKKKFVVYPDQLKAGFEEYGFPISDENYEMLLQKLGEPDDKGRLNYTLLLTPLEELS